MKHLIFTFLFVLLMGCTKAKEEIPDINVDLSAPEIDISNLGLDDLDISVSEPIDFGQVSSAKKLQIKLTNSGEEDLTISFDSLTNNFSMELNRCPSIILKDTSCIVQIRFTAIGLFNGIVNSNLVLNSGANIRSIPLVAQVVDRLNPSTSGTPVVEHNLTKTFDESHPTPIRDLVIKNTGDGFAKALSLVMPADYSIISSTCPQTLELNKQCIVKILHNNYKTQSAPTADIQVNYTGGSVPVNIACNTTFHKEGELCISNTKSCDTLPSNAQAGTQTWNGTSYDSCVISDCNAQYSLFENSCIDTVIDCSSLPSNASAGTQTWNGSSYDSCQISSCSLDYSLYNNQCYQNVIACSSLPTNATAGSQTWNGSSYNACQVSACTGNSLYPSNDGLSCAFKKSCLEIKTVNSGSTSGTYTIDPTGSEQIQVLCDMTTAGGGWTNISYNFGSTVALEAYSCAINMTAGNLPSTSSYYNSNCGSIAVSNLGVSTSSQSNSPLNGSLATLATNGTCQTPARNIAIKNSIHQMLNFTQISANTKSYRSSGNLQCGGFNGGAPWYYLGSGYSQITAFDGKAIYACDGFNAVTSTGYFTFAFNRYPVNVGGISTDIVGGLAPNCGFGGGTQAIQIYQIMVR